MSNNYLTYQSGLGSVGAYQVSGTPFVTGSLQVPGIGSAPLEITFPTVTKFICVQNWDTNIHMRVGFSANGVKGTNYFLVEPHKNNQVTPSMTILPLKVTKIYLSSANGTTITGSVIAGLTSISGYDLAAAYSGSVGIG